MRLLLGALALGAMPCATMASAQAQDQPPEAMLRVERLAEQAETTRSPLLLIEAACASLSAGELLGPDVAGRVLVAVPAPRHPMAPASLLDRARSLARGKDAAVVGAARSAWRRGTFAREICQFDDQDAARGTVRPYGDVVRIGHGTTKEIALPEVERGYPLRITARSTDAYGTLQIWLVGPNRRAVCDEQRPGREVWCTGFVPSVGATRGYSVRIRNTAALNTSVHIYAR